MRDLMHTNEYDLLDLRLDCGDGNYLTILFPISRILCLLPTSVVAPKYIIFLTEHGSVADDRILIRVECMYLSNTTLFDGRGVSSICYIMYNYTFRYLTMAIFRLYMKYLIICYRRVNMACIHWGGRR